MLAQSSGQTLELTAAERLGTALRHDFQGVRLHTDEPAAQAAEALDARAFALGRELYFGRSARQPLQANQVGTLAHELWHVAQFDRGALPSGALRVAPDGSAPEREAHAVAAGDRSVLPAHMTRGRRSASDAALILRIPSDLPQTAGAFRLGRALRDGRNSDLWNAVCDAIWNDQLGDIDTRFAEERPDVTLSATFADTLRPSVNAAAIDLATLTDAVSNELWRNYLDDLGSLVWDAFQQDAPDLTALGQDADRVGSTYQNLVYLRRYEQQNPAIVPPGGSALGDWFRTRARIFLDFARSSMTTQQFHDLMVALAAETDRLAHEDLRGPVNTAEVLVGELFEPGLSQQVVDQLTSLYRSVVDGLPPPTDSAEASAVRGLPEQVRTALQTDALQIERALRDAGDDARLSAFHRDLRRVIAEFLATAGSGTTPDPAVDVDVHLHALDDVLRRYGGTEGVALLIFWFEDACGWATTPEEPQEEEPEEPPAPEPPAPAPTPPVRTPPPQPTPQPAPQVCETVSASDLDAWIRSYWENRLLYTTWPLNAVHLRCGMAPSSPVTDAQAIQRISQFRTLVTGMLSRLDSQIRSAQVRATEINHARLELFPPPEAQVCQEAEDEPPAEPPPDFVSYFALSNDAYNLLVDALSAADFDTGRFLEGYVEAFADYFERLTLYQRNLVRALQLTARMRTTGAHELVMQDFPDDYGPAVRRILAEAEQSPAWTLDWGELARAEGLDYSLSRIAEVVTQAEETLRVRREEEIQQRISRYLPDAVSRVWSEEQRQGHTQTDYVTPGLVYPDPLKDLADIPDDMDSAARAFLPLALREFNTGTLETMAQTALNAARTTDTRQVAQLIARMQTLQFQLGTSALSQGIEELRNFNRGQSSFLIFLFNYAQPALSRAKNDGRLPGHLARTARLLQMVMQQGGRSTLSDTVRVFQVQFGLDAIGMGIQNMSQLTEGTYLSSIFDARFLVDSPYEVMNIVSEVAHDATNDQTALYWLLQAEQAGGGEARRAMLARLGDLLHAQGQTPCLVAARLLYAAALGVADRLHELMKPQEVLDAETWFNQHGLTPTASMAAHLSEEGRRKQEIIDAWERGVGETRAALDLHHNPSENNRDLTDQEEAWWASYKEIDGSDNTILPGEEGWSEIKDFGKELVFMAAVTWATGGVGGALTESLSIGGRAAFWMETGVTLFGTTAATRARQSLTTGVDPQTWFLEDLAVNAATMGASRLGAAAYARMFGLTQATAGLTRHVLGQIATEWISTNAVQRVYLSLSSAARGTSLTDEEIHHAYLSNAGFVVAFKAMEVLGHGVTRRLQQVPDTSPPHLSLLERLETLDGRIQRAAEDAMRAPTEAERRAALDRQERALQEKEQVLQRATNPEVRTSAGDFAEAFRLFQAEKARARVFGAVNMEPVRGTADLSYSRGGANERLLTQHLNEAGAEFTVTQGLHGLIFEVRTPDGPVRISPREPQLAGGTSAETYSLRGRLGHEEVLISGDHERLAQILAADPRIDPSIRAHLEHGGNTFSMEVGSAPVDVTLNLVSEFSSDAGGHDPGPAQYRISYDGGRFQVTIEVITRANNDQLGRSVNHEVREIRTLVEALAREANGHLDVYGVRTQLDQVLARERTAGVLSGGTAARPTAHDVAVLHEMADLAETMRDIRLQLDARPSAEEAQALSARLEVLDADFRRTWRASGLSADPAILESQLQRFTDAGVHLSPELRNAVGEARTAAEHGWESRGGVRVIDLHIIFAELQRSRSQLMQGISLDDLSGYWNERVRTRAQEVYDAALAHGSDPDLALSQAADAAHDLLGLQHVAAERGFAFEGLSAEERNADPTFRLHYGRYHNFRTFNFRTYDGVSVRGTGRAIVIDETPITNADGTQTAQLRITEEGSGTLIAHYVDGRPPTITVSPGFHVELWSTKARGHMDMGQMYRTVGSAATPHEGVFFTTPEGREHLQRSIDWTRDRITRLQEQVNAGDQSKRPELARMQRRLLDLQHFTTRIQESSAWTNERIDALLRSLRSTHIDVDAIIDGLYDRLAEDT